MLTRRTLLALMASAGTLPTAVAAGGFRPELVDELAVALSRRAHGSDWEPIAAAALRPAERGPIPDLGLPGLRPIPAEDGYGPMTDVLLVDGSAQAGPATAARASMGGFEIAAGPGPAAGVFQFIGATFFRMREAGQVFGTLARAIAIRTADPRGEEMPVFRAVWLDARDPARIGLHALVDSPSTTAACHMRLLPEPLALEIEIAVVPREDLASVGLAPLSATYLFAANDGAMRDDWRPSVHDARGLQMLNGNGERLWRTLGNPRDLQISAFADTSPRAFGLVQRDRRLETFQDVTGAFERRPSLFVEPRGDWGAGWVVLIEIPSASETNDNIQVFWQPETPLAAGATHRFAYRLVVADDVDPAPPPAIVRAVRSGAVDSDPDRRVFVIDYALAPGLSVAAAASAKASVWASAGEVGPIAVTRLPDGGARSRFEVRRPGAVAVELRADLYFDEAPPAEAWLHRWV